MSKQTGRQIQPKKKGDITNIARALGSLGKADADRSVNAAGPSATSERDDGESRHGSTARHSR
jgi:hypothetical protein